MNPSILLDTFLASLALWREARGESRAGKAAVLAVIRNRTEDPRNRWPKTMAQVVTQPYQFSSFNRNDPNVTQWPNPSHTLDWNTWVDCCDVVEVPLQADATGGAQFYHDKSIAPPAEAWLGPGRTVDELLAFQTYEIGNLVFYRIP